MLKRVSRAHGWRVEDTWDNDGDGAAKRLEDNWKLFLTGKIDHQVKEGKKAAKRRKQREAEETDGDG
jgi:hypothetical protein